MKRTWLFVGIGVLIGIGILLAVSSKSTSDTASTSISSSPIPTSAPTSEGLVGTWQWSRREVNGSQLIDPTGDTYSIELRANGTFGAQVDCNVVEGSYVAEVFEAQEMPTVEQGSFLFSPGPTTLAECGPESFYNDVLDMMAAAQDYRLEDSGQTLVFIWPAGGPLDYYVRIK